MRKANEILTHELKCWPEFFQAILDGQKTYEIRKNDRDFWIFDRVRLREYDPQKQYYTGREKTATIVHITTDFSGIKEGFCVFGIGG